METTKMWGIGTAIGVVVCAVSAYIYFAQYSHYENRILALKSAEANFHYGNYSGALIDLEWYFSHPPINPNPMTELRALDIYNRSAVRWIAKNHTKFTDEARDLTARYRDLRSKVLASHGEED